ncbi:hypothetical protein MRX96_025223 [Rhipicephalus microplus]
MAAVVCVVRLETGEQKKVVLPTGSYDELVHALSTHTAVDEQTLPTSSECTEAGPSSRAHDPSREHLNQSADSICTTELVEIHVPLRKQFDYLEFRLPAFGPYKEVLQRGKPVEGPVRRAIVNRIFQACFKIVWFPSKELYNTAVEQLIQKYPHLQDNIKKGTGMLQLEFNLLFKKNILDDVMKGFECLCAMILSHGHQEEKADTPLTPCIQRATDGTLVLHADNQRLFVASSLLSAVASLFSLFWVFHIKYPKKADRVLTFIEHAFVDLSQTKPKVKALELINFYKNFS